MGERAGGNVGAQGGIVGCGRVKYWKILVTGSNGLIGSEAVEYFDRQGHMVVGVDNNMRRVFFGPTGDTLWNLERLKSATRQFTPIALDIRDRDGVMALFRENRFDLILHCAAQPSHDKAAEIALLDFEVNALGTVNLLEATRQHCPEAAFIFMSTNKVYGETPNEMPISKESMKTAASIARCIPCSALPRLPPTCTRRSTDGISGWRSAFSAADV
jgi:nucleoside-diphosphate-sugar epimerase